MLIQFLMLSTAIYHCCTQQLSEEYDYDCQSKYPRCRDDVQQDREPFQSDDDDDYRRSSDELRKKNEGSSSEFSSVNWRSRSEIQDNFPGDDQNYDTNPSRNNGENYDELETQSQTFHDLAFIVSGLTSYEASRTNSMLQIMALPAFPILAGRAKNDVQFMAPVLAGSRVGQGRLIVGGGNNLAEPSKQLKGHNQLLLNCIRWLSANSLEKPLVGLYGHGKKSEVEKFLKSNSFTTGVVDYKILVSPEKLTKYTVLCLMSTYNFNENDKIIEAIQNYMENGGGVFVTNDGYSSSNKNLKKMNQLIQIGNIVWLNHKMKGTMGGKENNIYDINTAHILPYDHLTDLVVQIELLFNNQPSKLVESNIYVYVLKIFELAATIQSIVKNSEAYVQKIQNDVKYLYSNFPPLVVSKKNPVKTWTEKSKITLTCMLHHLWFEPQEVRAHPSRTHFPYDLLPNQNPQDEEREHSIYIDFNENGEFLPIQTESEQEYSEPQERNFYSNEFSQTPDEALDPEIDDDDETEPLRSDFRKRWYSTGMFAPAGVVIQVQIMANILFDEFIVRIGAQTSDHFFKPKPGYNWSRYYCLTTSSKFNSFGEAKLASPFGGLVYILWMGEHNFNAKYEIVMKGTIPAPPFILGQTDVTDWQEQIKLSRSPWLELVCLAIIFTVPTTFARTIKDPVAVMEQHMKVLESIGFLTHVSPQSAWPMRVVSDYQMPKGAGWYAGYPIHGTVSGVNNVLSLGALTSGRSWGYVHEVGHNHQISPLVRWLGSHEVTNNVMALYYYNHVLNMSMDNPDKKRFPNINQRISLPNNKVKVQGWVKRNRNYTYWQNQPDLALISYLQLQRKYGWIMFEKVFWKRVLPNEKLGIPHEARNAWVVKASLAAQENLFPFYRSWNIPVSQEEEQKVLHLPPTQLHVDQILYWGERKGVLKEKPPKSEEFFHPPEII